jgi:PTS system beta-glucosides-specific IIC component
MNWVGMVLADGYQWIVSLNPVIAGGLLGFVWPVCVMFGIQRCFVPIVMNNIATLGHDTLFVITGPNNFAQAGACLGVLLKTKNAMVKEVAAPVAIAALLAGTTEPAIYGINLKYKRPFYIAMVFTGIGGAIVAASGTYVPALIDTSLLTLPAYLASGVGPFLGFCAAAAISYLGSAICSYLFGFDDSMVVDGLADTAASES